MKLLTKSDLERLARNGRNAAAGATWLLAWTEPGDPDLAFGLGDLGLVSPELGSVRQPKKADVPGRGTSAFEPAV